MMYNSSKLPHTIKQRGACLLKTENQKQAVANEIWLNYFNSYLYDRGIITESERNKMKTLITSKCHAHRLKILSSRS